MTLKMTYIHNHDCESTGQQYVYQPPSDHGVAMVARPMCEETMMELRLLRTERV